MGSSRDGGTVVTRPLLAVDASDPVAVLEALRLALSAAGPAILPIGPDGVGGELPATVPEPIALVIQTSGSSGTAKRVELSSNALLASAAASGAALGGPGQWLLAVPVHYIAGINVLVRSIAAQTEPVILPPGHFDAREFLAAAETMDADARHYTSVVPAQLARLLDAADGDASDGGAADGDAADGSGALAGLRRFDRILVGGQSVPSELIDRAEALGIRVTRTYGSSETAGGCVYNGVPVGTTEVRIRHGEIEIRGPVLADGYLDDPARTERSFVMSDGARWYRTGDAGRVDNGVLTVTGRLDRVIISGGVKVSLDELERVLRRMPGLGDAVAVPAESARWGEVPVVVATSPVDLSALRGAVVTALAREAAPDRVVVLDSIPLLSTGKPDLVTLREIVARRN
ncbi:o-succinylbenzoate--CoA ligase [Marisediminicola antarctica]|uniref:AMP-binding protein n=1 Tax=Marisediminicola antarctica TaxID=674079 RepID=UPI001F3FEAC4|nr:AMP-binding protein [Marisediminicola antarctica]